MKKFIIYFLLFLPIYIYAQSPGNVSSGLQWWFESNSGTSTTTDAQQVDTWNNLGSFATSSVSRVSFSTSGYPMYKSTIFNYNPGIRFSSSSSSAFSTTFSGVHATDVLNMGPTADNSTTFIAFKSTQSSGGTNQYSSPNFISTERTVTIYDFEIGFTAGKVAIKTHHSSDNWSVKNSTAQNDGITRIASLTREKNATAANASNLNIYINAISNVTATTGGTSYSLNSSDYTTATTFCGFNIGAQVNSANSAFNGTTPYDGDIAEIIVYNTVLTSTELQKVQSYLAVKYGVTLGSTSNTYDYLNSAGSTIWTGNATYQNNILGIGRDDNSGLYQKQSQSVNSSILTLARLTAGSGNSIPSANSSNANTITSDQSYLICGDNAGSMLGSSTDVPSGISKRSSRVWKSTLTGTGLNSQNIRLKFDISSLGFTISDYTNYRLLLDADGTFATGSSEITPVTGNNGSSTIEFDVDMSSYPSYYFTLATTNNSSAPLPVIFADFYAQSNDENQIALHWKTSEERDIKIFDIEWSSDAKHWKDIGNEHPSNFSGVHSYVFYDTIPHHGTSYYRIVETDNQGEKTYSKTISIHTHNNFNFRLSPNPSDKQVIIYNVESDGKLLIYNENGVLLNEIELYKGEVDYFETVKFPQGIYFFKFITNDETTVQKLMIKH